MGQVPAGDCSYTGDWRELTRCLWRDAAPVAFAVQRCENRSADPNAIGPPTRYGRAHGIWQIMNGPFDPEANTRLAFAMYRKSRWSPWASSRGCWAGVA